MWILEGSPPRWLAPNKTYILGRKSVKPTDQADFIPFDVPSISRNHLSITVGEPDINDAGAVTVVKFTDLKSKFGSYIDEKTLKSPVESTSTNIMVQLGPSTTLKLKWTPVVVAYSTGEDGEAHKIMFEHAKSVLQPLDIKLTTDITDDTTLFLKGTHSNRQLALALVKNLPILGTQFLNAIRLLAPSLEQDFGEWPEYSQFLANPLWAPNRARVICFSGQHFLTVEEDQLMMQKPVIEGAGGTLTLVDTKHKFNTMEILILPRSKELPKQITTKSAIQEADILKFITTASAAHPDTGRRRPKRADMMEFLTQSSAPQPVPHLRTQSKVEPIMEPSVQVKEESPPRKRPLRTTMMDHLVGKRQKIDDAAAISESITIPHGAGTNTDGYKRPAATVANSGAKKPRVQDADGILVDSKTASPSSPEPSEIVKPFVDLDTTVSGLAALVECRLSYASKKVPQITTDPEWQGKPNFKAFRRKHMLSQASSSSHSIKQTKQRVKLSVYSDRETPINASSFNSTRNSRTSSSASFTPDIQTTSFTDTNRISERIHDPDADGEFGFTFGN